MTPQHNYNCSMIMAKPAFFLKMGWKKSLPTGGLESFQNAFVVPMEETCNNWSVLFEVICSCEQSYD